MNVSDLALQVDALASAMGTAVGELDISVGELQTSASSTQSQLTAFNAAQAVQDTNISNLSTRQGSLASLTTTAKDNLVNAINEVDAIAATALQSSEKGVAGGLATLDGAGKVPASQLPSFVDDVVEVDNHAALPVTGEAGKIYVTLDNGKIYRWGGSTYSEISAAPGTTDAVVEGSNNLYFTVARAQAAVTSVTGNAGTATKLATARTISVTGDATASGSFDGSANLSLALTLANSGVTAGSYGNTISIPTFSVDGKGRVTSVTQLGIRSASTAVSGITMLTDSVGSTSVSSAATPNAVKTAYDLANSASVTANAAIPASQRGVADGVASLDATGKVPAAQLPSFVDDVIEGSTITAFPGTGETGKIYVALDTGKTYRWSGSAYVEISASPGSTDAVPEGVTNLYFTVARAQSAVTAITGNAGTATKLQTARTLAVSGDATGSVSFDGSANATIAVTLANSGVTAGNYGDAITIPDITVDGKGRVTGMTTNTVRSATTAQTGVVQLSDSTSTTSSALAATSTAVKAAYDLANTANTTANAAIPATQKGAANGVATLDSGGKVPSAQLPSFVDDVLEYANQAGFPATGSAGIIYVALDTNNVYRWSGTVYVEIAASPGSTDSVTEGSVNLYFTAARAQAAVTTITGNAGTATKLATARTIGTTGDATGSGSFDGSANLSFALTLATTGVAAGTYPVVTVDTKGRVTAGRALTVSDLPAAVAETDVNQTWSKAQRGAVTSVAYATTIALDLSLSNNFETTLTGNTTMGLPTNIVVGQSGMIKVTQDATGGRTMAFNSVFKFAGGTAPVLSTAANAVDELCYYVDSASRIVITALKDVK